MPVGRIDFALVAELVGHIDSGSDMSVVVHIDSGSGMSVVGHIDSVPEAEPAGRKNSVQGLLLESGYRKTGKTFVVLIPCFHIYYTRSYSRSF